MELYIPILYMLEKPKNRCNINVVDSIHNKLNYVGLDICTESHV